MFVKSTVCHLTYKGVLHALDVVHDPTGFSFVEDWIVIVVKWMLSAKVVPHYGSNKRQYQFARVRFVITKQKNKRVCIVECCRRCRYAHSCVNEIHVLPSG